MKGQSEIKSYKDYIKLFSQRTSIRGVSKIENSKMSVIKWFWAIFIVSALAIMVTFVVLSVNRYLRYDTVIKGSVTQITASDFPEITICSKRFFDTFTNETPSPFYYLDEYSSRVLSQIFNLVNNKSIDDALWLVNNQLITSSFFYKYYKFIKDRTTLLALQLNNSCTINAQNGKGTYSTIIPCSIKPVYNPMFLNCLAFRIPDQIPKNLANFQMTINLDFITRPDQYITDNFRVDEYTSDISDDDGFEVTRVYMHPVSDYPFDFDYEIPINCQSTNHFQIEKSQTEMYYIPGSNESCRQTDVYKSSYGVQFKVTRETLCDKLIIQNQIFQKCNCYYDIYPNENTSYPTSNMCSTNDTFLLCAMETMDSAGELLYSSCLSFCTKTKYFFSQKLKPLYSSKFSKDIGSLSNAGQNCDNNNDTCTSKINCLMSELFQQYPQLSCDDSDTVQSDSSTTLNLNSDTITTDSTCKFVSLKFEMRSIMSVNKESLVVEINTLFSQLGGLCAFFTGLTFTIIAEVLETFIFWIMDKVENRTKPSG